MNKKLFIVLAIESVLIIAVALIGFRAYTGNFDIQNSLFHRGEGGDNVPTRPPKSNISTTEDMPYLNLPQIKAEVEVLGNVVKVWQEIYLTDKVESFKGNIFAKNFADVKVLKVGAGSGIKSYNVQELMFNVELLSPDNVLYIDYIIELNEYSELLLWSEDMIKLTNFLITPAVYRNGEVVNIYKTNFGDPFIYDLYDYNITLSAEKKYSVYAPGKISERPSSGVRTYEFFASNMRDFPVIICKEKEVSIVDRNGIKIYYINIGDVTSTSTFVDYSMAFARDNIGAYPYNEFFVVKTKLNSLKGMEFSCMIFIDDEAFGNIEYLKSLVYHEVFHQWFYGIIGTDQLNEPFLDEGMATYLSAYLRSRGDAAYYDRTFIDKTLSSYYSKSQYDNLAYTQASNYFSLLHKKMGDNFFEMLKKIYEEKRFGHISYDEFLQYIETYG